MQKLPKVQVIGLIDSPQNIPFIPVELPGVNSTLVVKRWIGFEGVIESIQHSKIMWIKRWKEDQQYSYYQIPSFMQSQPWVVRWIDLHIKSSW